MSRLYQGNENWVFESDNGIEYSIYKGMGDGKAKQVNSDIFFIILDEYWEDDVSTEFIGWGYGADFIGEDEEYTDIVKGMVYDFEKSHPLIVAELGKERPFADNEAMMADFFYYDRKEFLNKYGSIRDCDYDATAKIVAKRIASIKTWN